MSMIRWEIVVGNVGTVWNDTNGFRAIQQFNEWCRISRTGQTDNGAGADRAHNEPVTLLKDGEPYREFDPDAGWFFIEMTDTYGGEANYCWVNRYKVRANTHIGALKRAATGYSWRHDYDMSDEYGTKRYNAVKACVCCFVSAYSRDAHNHYMHVKEVP